MNHEEKSEIDLHALLRSIDALSLFDDEQIALIAEVVHPQYFKSDEEIYNEGDSGTDFLFIGSGEVDASRETPVGIQRVAVLGPGETCGEISLLDGKPRSSGVCGRIPGVLLRFDNNAIASLVAEDPKIEIGFLSLFCRSLARKIRQANLVMTQIMAPDVEESRAASGTKGERGVVDDDAKKSLLREQGMSREDLEQLAAYLDAEKFASGDSIFVEGEAGDTLYIVAEGQVRISRHIPGMGEEALAILGRGEVFGEMAWIDASPRSADAVAHTGGCTVVGISGEHLDGTLGAEVEIHARFLKLICQVLCRRIRNMNDQLVAYRTMAFF